MEFTFLHKRALAVADEIRKLECEMIDLLQAIEACRGFAELGYTSLFVYVTGELGLSEDCAYKLITVSRKAKEVPLLFRAIAEGTITVSKAVVISPVITVENSEHWISMASSLSKRNLEKAVAEVRPEAGRKEKAKPIGNKMVRLELDISEEAHALLIRARELIAQKKTQNVSLAETLLEIAGDFVKRNDPVEKADRNTKKTRPGASSKNLHKVHHRDRGRCQFKHSNGKFCGERKWLHVHHRKPKSEGGGDEPENLVTLCAAHHRMVHENGMPLH